MPACGAKNAWPWNPIGFSRTQGGTMTTTPSPRSLRCCVRPRSASWNSRQWLPFRGSRELWCRNEPHAARNSSTGGRVLGVVVVGDVVFVGSGCGPAGHPLASNFGLALVLCVVRVVRVVALAVVRLCVVLGVCVVVVLRFADLCVVVVLLVVGFCVVDVGAAINTSGPQLPTVGTCFGACSWVLRGVLCVVLRVV